MTHVRKHLTEAEANARRLYPRAEWRRRGVVIDDDAKPQDTMWMPRRAGLIEVFDNAQGRVIAFNPRELDLKATLELIRDGQGKGKTDTEILARVREIARDALKTNY